MVSKKGGVGANYVYGVHAVRSLIDKRPEAILKASVLKGSRAGTIPELTRRLENIGITVEPKQRSELDQMSNGGAHQGIIVRTRGHQEVSVQEFEELVIKRGKSFRCLVLDEIQDPRNLGACLRTADAAGIDAVLVPRRRAAGLTAAALKAAAGAADTVPLVRVSNIAATLRWLRGVGVWIVGADSEMPVTVYDARLASPITIVVGGEGQGLRRLTRELCDEIVSIPMEGTVGSLNVSVATGVLLFELQRQINMR
ncbi:MAG: 23S rRNA (guanosine(2251)-2'-O)-methyltransferase RlmB [Candidatus Rariloculaceae bacterium]